LKNTIDWASRSEPGERPLECFAGKTVALMSASPGALGGLRGLTHLRQVLSNIQLLVLPEQKAISGAHEAFGTDGKLLNPKDQDAVEKIGARLASVVSKLSN
jgi:NAD(P)H-dependent FMN reductase